MPRPANRCCWGFSKNLAEDLLDEFDFSLVERALALLGEIGNPASLPAIAEFLSFDDRRPRRVRPTGPSAGSPPASPKRLSQRSASWCPRSKRVSVAILGDQLAMTPDAPGRGEAFDEVIARAALEPGPTREPFVFAAIASLYVAEGGQSARAKELEARYADSFSREARADLRTLHQEVRGVPPYERDPDELTSTTSAASSPRTSPPTNTQEPIRGGDPSRGATSRAGAAAARNTRSATSTKTHA